MEKNRENREKHFFSILIFGPKNKAIYYGLKKLS
jgi:hypothetical protein